MRESFTLNGWQDHVDSYTPEVDLRYCSIGFGGESGEVLNQIKKELRGDGSKREEIKLELGDSLYYLTCIAKYYGYTLEDIMESNVSKLAARHAAQKAII